MTGHARVVLRAAPNILAYLRRRRLAREAERIAAMQRHPAGKKR